MAQKRHQKGAQTDWMVSTSRPAAAALHAQRREGNGLCTPQPSMQCPSCSWVVGLPLCLSSMVLTCAVGCRLGPGVDFQACDIKSSSECPFIFWEADSLMLQL